MDSGGGFAVLEQSDGSPKGAWRLKWAVEIHGLEKKWTDRPPHVRNAQYDEDEPYATTPWPDEGNDEGLGEVRVFDGSGRIESFVMGYWVGRFKTLGSARAFITINLRSLPAEMRADYRSIKCRSRPSASTNSTSTNTHRPHTPDALLLPDDVIGPPSPLCATRVVGGEGVAQAEEEGDEEDDCFMLRPEHDDLFLAEAMTFSWSPRASPTAVQLPPPHPPQLQPQHIQAMVPSDNNPMHDGDVFTSANNTPFPEELAFDGGVEALQMDAVGGLETCHQSSPPHKRSRVDSSGSLSQLSSAYATPTHVPYYSTPTGLPYTHSSATLSLSPATTRSHVETPSSLSSMSTSQKSSPLTMRRQESNLSDYAPQEMEIAGSAFARPTLTHHFVGMLPGVTAVVHAQVSDVLPMLNHPFPSQGIQGPFLSQPPAGPLPPYPQPVRQHQQQHHHQQHGYLQQSAPYDRHTQQAAPEAHRHVCVQETGGHHHIQQPHNCQHHHKQQYAPGYSSQTRRSHRCHRHHRHQQSSLRPSTTRDVLKDLMWVLYPLAAKDKRFKHAMRWVIETRKSSSAQQTALHEFLEGLLLSPYGALNLEQQEDRHSLVTLFMEFWREGTFNQADVKAEMEAKERERSDAGYGSVVRGGSDTHTQTHSADVHASEDRLVGVEGDEVGDEGAMVVDGSDMNFSAFEHEPACVSGA